MQQSFLVKDIVIRTFYFQFCNLILLFYNSENFLLWFLPSIEAAKLCFRKAKGQQENNP